MILKSAGIFFIGVVTDGVTFRHCPEGSKIIIQPHIAKRNNGGVRDVKFIATQGWEDTFREHEQLQPCLFSIMKDYTSQR